MERCGLKQAYEEYHERVLHVAFDVLQDHGLAEEVCVDVFVEFCEEMEDLSEWRIRGWLLENAKRNAIQRSKRPCKKKEQGLIVEYKVERRDKR